MCGIVGVSGNIPPKETIEKASDRIAHRGPDDAGLFYNKQNGIALGHRRLSIIDLSDSGHQPMQSPDGRYTIIFNGEIYNYIEIKKELEVSYQFQTKTDTEVLLASYIIWGKECLHKLNGMFAFVIWDQKEQLVFGARDRLGIKPFFYHIEPNGTILFASEIKTLLMLGVEPKPNDQMIYDYLAYGYYDHTDETFFEDIHSLKPGHFFEWKDYDFIEKTYWSLANVVMQKDDLSEEEVKRRFIELIKDSIRLRFRSDVAVGINLSSGLDSNSLYYFGLEITGKDIHTFSMCVKSEKYNECPIIDRLLDPHQKSLWHRCMIDSENAFALMEHMNEVQDQPFGGIPTIVYDNLQATAKKDGVTVLLEGQGLDELLGGYKYYMAELEKDLANTIDVHKDIENINMYSQDMTKEIDATILNDSFVKKYKISPPSFEKPFASHLLNAQYRDLRFTKLPRVLRFNDHVSMFYGRELRLPYLDHRLVEFCFSLPTKYKIRGGEQKVLMRDVMKDIIPERIKNTQKKGFGAVQTEWFKKYYKKQVMELLHSDSFRSRGYWNYDALEKKVNDFYENDGKNSFFIWQCFNLEMWFKTFIDNV